MSDVFDDTSDGRVALSPAGTRRREEILRSAIREGQSVRHRRRVVRAAAGGVAAALAVAVALVAMRPRPTPPPSIVVQSRPTHTVTVPRPQVVVQRIETDPHLMERLSIRPDGKGWQTLSDDELLRQLDRAGRPAALAYVGGQERLLWRAPTRVATR